ncbi:Uncharacterized protein QTN25_008667 [Entamoeba marina]
MKRGKSKKQRKNNGQNKGQKKKKDSNKNVELPSKLLYNANPTIETSIIQKTTMIDSTIKSSYYEHLKTLNYKEIEELIKYIPMRLTSTERGYLEILESALEVCEYTNNVDVAKSDYMYYGIGYKRDVGVTATKKERIIHQEHEDLKRILIGLLLSSDIKQGLKIINDQNLLEEFMQNCFEVGRRYKASNPSMMRTTYQKMMHVLQDAIVYNPHFIGKKFCKDKKWKKIQIVGDVMEQHHIPLEDILFAIDLKDTGLSLNELTTKYGNDIINIIYSIKDGIEASTKTCGVVHDLLVELSDFEIPTKSNEISIQFGKNGSKLTHTHEVHYIYVKQSLMLWWNVMRHMPMLWNITDGDFLSGAKYLLCNTGQGLQRMQQCPGISNAMNCILQQTQKSLCNTSWKGLSVVHLGDRDVPNCLFFIDKYSQVPWIISPILRTHKRLNNGIEDKRIPLYFEQHSSKIWGKVILRHFFKNGFDGSGSDGGSCIDGRLTSAWNWCSRIEKYSYHPLFLLCDFEGFEGPYKK